jgi:PRC-barrel domain
MDDKLKIFTIAALVMLLLSNPVPAQVAGYAAMVVNAQTLMAVTEGYSAQKSILQQPVYNDEDEPIGTIDDLIIDPVGSVTYAIIGAGEYVGNARHDVAIHLGHLSSQNGKFVLRGATAEAIRALPEFNYLQ